MNRLVWPRADCLAGVTMALINRFHNEQTSTAPVADVPEMCAAFATNAPVGIRTISAIDGTRWTDEPPLISALRKEYSDIPAEEL